MQMTVDLAGLNDAVLIPFKQGGVFQWVKNFTRICESRVLIPFKQGGVFQ